MSVAAAGPKDGLGEASEQITRHAWAWRVPASVPSPNPLCLCSIPPAALHLASRHARLACVKVLLEAGARQLCDRQGCTPRQLAEQAGNTDVLDMVRQHEEVQAELQQQADGQQRQLAEGGRPAGEEGT